MKAANDNRPTGASVRFVVQPRLVPATKAARRLHLLPEEFAAKAEELWRISFPRPCPVTGHYDLQAIEAWLDRRAGIGQSDATPDADALIRSRLDAFG